MNKQKLKWQRVYSIGFLTVACFILVVSFQNCNAVTSQMTSLRSYINENSTQANEFANLSVDRPLQLSTTLSSDGYIFYGEYGVNPSDKKGNKVCDFPSLNNCRTNEGAAVVVNSGLQSSAPLHMLTFDFQSNGYFKNNPIAHFAVGIRGNITRNASGKQVAINGRGFIVGTLGVEYHKKNPACGTNMLEIESYHGDVGMNDPAIPYNHVFSDTCSDSILTDGNVYRMELYVSLDRKIGYKIFDAQSKLIHTKLMSDPYNYINPKLTDLFFGHVFDNDILSAAGNWNITISNVRVSESSSRIEDFFRDKMLNFSLGNSIIANNSVVSYEQVKNRGLFVGSFPAARTRIFACANPASEVDSGRACNLAEGFRVVEFSQDASFVKLGSALKVQAEPLLNYLPNLYKLVFRTNPESSDDQVVIQIDSRSTAPASFTPPPSNNLPLPDNNLIRIARYFSPEKSNHFFENENFSNVAPPTYVREKDVISIYSSSGDERLPLQLCATSMDYFLSVDLGCEQQTVMRTLGYVSKMANNLRPLYRCVRDSGHLSTTNVNECNSYGYRVEGILGYVP